MGSPLFPGRHDPRLPQRPLSGRLPERPGCDGDDCRQRRGQRQYQRLPAGRCAEAVSFVEKRRRLEYERRKMAQQNLGKGPLIDKGQLHGHETSRQHHHRLHAKSEEIVFSLYFTVCSCRGRPCRAPFFYFQIYFAYISENKKAHAKCVSFFLW